MKKLTERENELFANHIIERAKGHIERAGYGEKSTPTTFRVDDYTLKTFKSELKKYNENRKKFDIGPKVKEKELLDRILWDYYLELKILNEKFDQKEMDI
jgi:hypothetical protein